MKKLLFLFAFFPFFLCFAKKSGEVDVSPFPAYDAYSQKPVTKEEISQMLDSPQFRELTEQLMPGTKFDMTQEEREAIIEDTIRFAEKMESLPPEEQEKELEAMFKQLPVAPPTKPTPAPEPTVKPKPIEQPAAAKLPKETISPKKVESLKELLQKLVKSIEDIELKFESMARVSSDILMEQKWANIKKELPFTVSALKRISNKPELLEKLASQEFKLLYTQVKELHNDLQPHRKKLAIPDTSMLEKLSPTDLSRAKPVTESQKKSSQKAVHNIINILDKSIQNVIYGGKKLLEKYAATELKELEKLLPREAIAPSTKTTDTGASSSPYDSRRGSRSGYSGSPSYYRSDYGKQPSGRQQQQRGKTSQAAGKKMTDAQKKKQAESEKSALGKETDKKAALGEEGKKGKEKTQIPDKIKKALEELQGTIDDLEKESKKALEENIEATLKNFPQLDMKEKDIQGQIRTIGLAMQDTNPVVTKLTGKISTFLDTIKNFNTEMQDAHKKLLKEYLQKQPNTQKLVSISKELTKLKNVVADDLEKVSFIDYFNTFLSNYQQIIEKLQTVAVLQTNLSEINDKIDKNIKQGKLIEILEKGSAAELASEKFKQELTLVFDQLGEYQKVAQKNATSTKSTMRAISGEAQKLVNILDSKNMPVELQTKAQGIKRQLTIK